MRRGFTVIEIIFVVTIAAILIGIAAPRLLQKDDLSLAADQVINHIRYTQHLALMEDKFDPNDGNWKRRAWRIRFSDYRSNVEYGSSWSYTIFSDQDAGTNNAPIETEMAKNPLIRNQLLSGGFNDSLPIDTEEANPDMLLGRAYSIDTLSFSGCGGRTIAFDEIGRPYYMSDANMNPIENTCTITLTHQSGDTAQICIEPETGYTHRCD